MFTFLSAVIFLTMQCLPILNIAMFDARSMFLTMSNWQWHWCLGSQNMQISNKLAKKKGASLYGQGLYLLLHYDQEEFDYKNKKILHHWYERQRTPWTRSAAMVTRRFCGYSRGRWWVLNWRKIWHKSQPGGVGALHKCLSMSVTAKLCRRVEIFTSSSLPFSCLSER